MSAAGEELARACKHPKVKGSRRALLDAIATLIPEGQTMTRAVPDKELSALIDYDERTIRDGRAELAEIGVLRVVGGGQGRSASYELLALPGAGAPPSLPLRADLREAPKRRPASSPEAPTLFDEEPVAVVEAHDTISGERAFRVYTVGSFFRSVVTKPRIFFPMLLANFGSFFRSVVKKPRIFFPKLPQDVDGTRARATYNNLRTTTTTAAETTNAPPPKPAPCRWHGTVHAWCDGRVHVPMPLHLELRRREPRHAGETDADVDERLFTRYAAECAALRDDERITDDEFTFWKRRLRAASSAGPAPANADPIVDVYERAKQQRRWRHGGGSS